MVRILGYHGTTVENGEKILASRFNISRADTLWLGHGIYFFQDAPIRAQRRANLVSHERSSRPFLIRAVIETGNCLDLLDWHHWSLLKKFYDQYESEIAAEAENLPDQMGSEFVDRTSESYDTYRSLSWRRYKDNLLINTFVKYMEKVGITFDTIRCPFVSGSPIFRESWIFKASSVVVNVLDHSAILHQSAAALHPET